MFNGNSGKSITIIILSLLLVLSCAKQGGKPSHKKITSESSKEEMIQEQNQGQTSSPEYSAANRMVSKGINEYNSQQFEKAARTLEAAVNIEPNNGEAYFWLAKTHLMFGDTENAKQFLDRASQYLTDDDSIEKLNSLEEQIINTEESKDTEDNSNAF